AVALPPSLTATRFGVQLARTFGRLRSPSRPRSLVMHQALHEAELDDREPEHQDKEHDRFGARESELAVLECVEIDAVDPCACCVDGAAARQEVDLRKRLQHGD